MTDRFAGLARQPEAASLLPEIDQLKEQTGQIQKARTDLPKREAELKEHIEQRQRLCTDWKLDPETLPQITAEQSRQIDALAKQYVSLQSKREDLPRRISALESRQLECELAMAALPAAGDTSTIAQILKQIPAKRQSGGDTQRIRRERDLLRAALTRDLAALPLWTGTADALETIRIPLPVTVSEIQNRFTKWQTLFEQAERDRQRLVKDAEAAEAALLNLERQGSIPTEDELAAARIWRGLGWQAVKERWLQGLGEESAAASTFLEGMAETLPTVFEASIVAADTIADRLRMEADRVENKRTRIAELDRIKTRIAEQDAELESRVQGQKALTAEWEALWLDSKVMPRSPREMADWIEQRKLLIDKLRDLRRLDDFIAEAEEEERVWCESLTQALQAVPGQSLASLVGMAETKIDGAEAIAKRRNELNQSLREAQRDLGVELDALRANEGWLTAWRQEWSKTIAALPLSAESDPTTAQALVGVIGDLRTATDAVSKLRYRIDAMLRDEQGYADQVSAIACKAGRPDLASIDPLLAINDLQKVARTAYEAEAEFTRLTKDNERWRRNLAAADGEIDNSEADLEQLLLQSGIANATQVPEAIEKSKRKAELSKSIAENKRALTQAAGSTPLDTFLNDIEAASPDARSMELRELEQRIERLENDKAEKMREQERIQNEFRLREDASAVSEASCEKYSAAARIDLLLAEYVRNYIAAELLRKAVALYSDKHQDPLLRSAGEYFKELTCGAFSGILIEQGRNGRGLKAERQNGVRMSIERLSDGTETSSFWLYGSRTSRITAHRTNPAQSSSTMC